MVTIKDFDAAGKSTSLSCPLPTDIAFDKWTTLQKMVMLKRGMWKACSIPDILWGVSYAHDIGADPMRGELFPTGDGRWGTSNKYKIKQALRTGKIKGISVDIRDTGEKVDLPGCVQKTDLECTVTVDVDGWAKPIIRKSRLSRWYKSGNPNWKGNPEHMLELNTVAHALEYVEPVATEDDEAPPLT
jgi:hypothetical protein